MKVVDLSPWQEKADQFFLQDPEAVHSLHSTGRIIVVSDDLDLLTRYIKKTFATGTMPRFIFLHDTIKETPSIEVLSSQAKLSGTFTQFNLVDGAKNYQADIVIDLTTKKLLSKDRLGYFYHPDDIAFDEISDLVGGFDKPIYVQINSDICAFGNGHLSGCRKCLDHCEVQAISVKNKKIQIDDALCQGNGDCVNVCPSGAITYQLPEVEDSLTFIKNIIKEFISEVGQRPNVVFVTIDFDAKSADLNIESTLFIRVESLAIIDMTVLLLCLCYGANNVFFEDGETTDLVVKTIDQTNHLLLILGYLPVIQKPDQSFDSVKVLEQLPFGEKRKNLFLAIDYLFDLTGLDSCTLDLPTDYGLGKVQVNTERCTLCYSCVNACPSRALIDQGALPALLFKQENCLQCGLCESACPEQAIDLHSELMLDRKQRQHYELLHEEPPVLCRKCNTPFATQKVLKVIEGRLKDNPHFSSLEMQESIYLCADCKVAALLE